jgi:hypothetical protein
MKARRRIAVTLVVLLTSTATGHAALGDEIANDAAGVAASAWEAAKAATGGLGTAAGSLFASPDPSEYLPARMPNRDRRFLALMEAAGYRLAAIDTDEGLFGRVRYRFRQQRALSPGDLERLRHGLAEHRARHPGAVASAERRALRGLLAVGAATGFRVAAVNVDLRPWPKVSFHLIARDPIAAPLRE